MRTAISHGEGRSRRQPEVVQKAGDVEAAYRRYVDDVTRAIVAVYRRHVNDTTRAIFEFLADPGDGVFTQRLAGDGDVFRLTKTNCLDVPGGVSEADRGHGGAVVARQCQLKFERIRCGGQLERHPVSNSHRVSHDDSSTGGGPAASGHADSVEATARRGHDSGPDGLDNAEEEK